MELLGVLWITLLSAVGPCAAGLWDESILTKAILAQLDRNLSQVTRPSPGGAPVEVEMSVELLEVRELSKKTAIAELYVEETYMWYEPRAQWEISEFPGVSQLRLPARALWRPDVFMTNDQSMNPDALIGHVTVTWDGHVTWSPRVIHKTKCATTKPASRRNRTPDWECHLDYVCKDYGFQEVTLKSAGGSGMDISHTIEHDDWEVKRSEVQETGSVVSYSLLLAEIPYVRRVITDL